MDFQMIDLMEVSKSSQDDSGKHFVLEDASTKKRFLPHLMNLDRNQEVPHDYVLEESQIMYFVGTEISAAVLSSTLLVLGMNPDVQVLTCSLFCQVVLHLYPRQKSMKN